MKKSYILVFYLGLFIFFLELYSLNINILNQKQTELIKYDRLNTFSLIESNVLQKVINLFYTYNMNDFTVETDLGMVFIYFVDETAYIKYDFETPLYGKLKYDLIYNSCIDYEYISEALCPIVDKLNS